MQTKKLKSFIKGAATKETFGSNPLDPWSTKANIAESASLNKYLMSRGINPQSLSMASKVAYAKSSAFLQWKSNHMNEEHDSVKKPLKKESDTSVKGNQNSEHMHNEEVESLDEVSKDLLARYSSKRELDPKTFKTDKKARQIHKSLEIAASKSGDKKALPHAKVKATEEVELDETKKLSAHEKLVRSLKRGGYDVDANAKFWSNKVKELKAQYAKEKEDELKKANESVEQKGTRDIHGNWHQQEVSKGVTKSGKHGYFTGGLMAWPLDKDEHDKPHEWHKANAEKHGFKYVVREEVESLDEISRTDLENYKSAKEFNSLSKHTKRMTDKQIKQSAHRFAKYRHQVVNHKGDIIQPEKYPNLPEEVEQLQELSPETKASYTQKSKEAIKSLKPYASKSKFPNLATQIIKRREKGIKLASEDVGDPKAAVNADGLNTQMDTMQAEAKRQRSKSARIIKALYKKKGMKEETEHEDPYQRGLSQQSNKNPHPKGSKEHKDYEDAYRMGYSERRSHYEEYVREDMYDHEKEDKSVATYGKKPKHDKADDKDNKGENKPKAAAVLSGGTTLTGSPRDTVEIDPMMRLRPGQPDPTKKDDKKKDDKKKDEFGKDK